MVKKIKRNLQKKKIKGTTKNKRNIQKKKNLKEVQRIRFQVYKESIPLLANLSRPILVLILITMFWTSLNQLIWLIPSVFERTSEFTMGDLAIDIADAIFSDPPATISQSLEGLSTEAVTFLLKEPNGANSSQGYYCETTRVEIYSFNPEIIELENRGLVIFTQREDSYCETGMWYWSLSEKGAELYSYLKEIVIDEFMVAWEKSR